jgi:uncharacterized OB-fold protein
MTIESAEPALYRVDPDGTPVLLATQDPSGYTAFPRQAFGSEKTGAHDGALTPIELAGTGRIAAVVTVHQHWGDDLPTPFAIASVLLDEGPVVRAVLTDAAAGEIGDRVTAVTVTRTRDGAEVAELRFAVHHHENGDPR